MASQLAYSPADEVEAQAKAWGFNGCVFLDNKAAQGFLAWTSDVAMVTFRGTESTADWLSNIHLTTRTLPGVGRVHAGFLGQFRALQPELEHLLDAQPQLPLLVTGHSLGGGIAALAAITWAATRPVRALYTYGQPAVAKDASGAAVIGTTLEGRYHRLVNDADIVPRVPPAYCHAGQLLHFDGQGRVTSKNSTPQGPRPGARGASQEASQEPGDTMLSLEEFEALQQQLHNAPAARGQEGTRGLVSDHMLPGYLNRVRQQMG